MTDEQKCSTHPGAPHGFNRNASHTMGRYVCDCEGWVPPTVREMIEAAWLAGYYNAGYTNDSAYASQQAAKCADEFLGKEGTT